MQNHQRAEQSQQAECIHEQLPAYKPRDSVEASSNRHICWKAKARKMFFMLKEEGSELQGLTRRIFSGPWWTAKPANNSTLTERSLISFPYAALFTYIPFPCNLICLCLHKALIEAVLIWQRSDFSSGSHAWIVASDLTHPKTNRN